MNKPYHTPGPWTVGAGSCHILAKTARVANTAPRMGGPVSLAECNANAYLIAASPEMLETLRMVECALMPSDGAPDRFFAVRAAVAVVIAKAERKAL